MCFRRRRACIPSPARSARRRVLTFSRVPKLRSFRQSRSVLLFRRPVRPSQGRRGKQAMEGCPSCCRPPHPFLFSAVKSRIEGTPSQPCVPALFALSFLRWLLDLTARPSLSVASILQLRPPLPLRHVFSFPSHAPLTPGVIIRPGRNEFPLLRHRVWP